MVNNNRLSLDYMYSAQSPQLKNKSTKALLRVLHPVHSYFFLLLKRVEGVWAIKLFQAVHQAIYEISMAIDEHVTKKSPRHGFLK